MTTHNTHPLPTLPQLIKATGVALIAAGAILITSVLPAEHGIDPTGIGKALGLTALHNSQGSVTKSNGNGGVAAAVAAPVISTPVTISSKQVTLYRADTRQITLQPGEGLEFKTRLEKGAALIYSWKTQQGEKINHEFHGEPLNAKADVYESYILEKHVSESSGALIAPFTGTHGWYWRNKNTTPVAVTLNASGFYTDIFRN
ncbi:MAG: hypothetical protein ACYCY5_13820 [Sulfuricella sp.]